MEEIYKWQLAKKPHPVKVHQKDLDKGLGRGINALIPEEPAETNEKVIVKEVVVKDAGRDKR